MSTQNNSIPTMIDGSSSAAHALTQMERDDYNRMKQDNERLIEENRRYKNVTENVSCPDCGGHGIQAKIARRLQVGGVVNNESSSDESSYHESSYNESSYDESSYYESSGSRNMEASSREQQHLGMPGGEVINDSFLSQMIISSAEPGQGQGQGQGQGMMPYSSGAMNPIDQENQQQQQLLQQLVVERNFKVEKNMILNMAMGAMAEVDKLSQMGEPMWIPNNADTNTHQLNEEEYFRNFSFVFGPRPANFHCEGTRHSTIVAMPSGSLIDIFLNLIHFKSVFNAIVARAMTLEVVSTGTGTGNYSGTLQVIYTELQMLCHLVPTRHTIFARYCRQLGEGRWGIADISVDIFRPIHQVKYRKRPSGCIIEDLPNGFSKVTWVEHVEVQEMDVHPIFRPLVDSGSAFGAKRWLGILERQTDRVVNVLSQALPYHDIVVTNMRSKLVINRMAERMVTYYNAGVGVETKAPWSNVAVQGGANELKILMLRNVDHPGRPIGVVVNATVSFWLPARPMIVFEYIRNPERRHEWDVNTSGGRVAEISRTVIGRDNSNCISLLRNSESTMLILQEANWDPLGAYLIYSPVDVKAVNLVTGASGDSDNVPLLPSGFVVFPDSPNGGASNSMVTISFQVLVDSSPAAQNLQESFLNVANLIINTTNGLVNYFNARRDALSIL